MSFGLSASDLIALPNFAWQVYKKCRESSDDFSELSSEVASLHAVLTELNTLVRQCPLISQTSSKTLGIVLQGCHNVLKALEVQLAKYRSLGTNNKRMRDRTRWVLEAIGDVRIRLVSHTTILTL